MEQKRLDRVIGRYEEAAEDELLRLAREEGLEAAEASVVIEQDSRNPDFGKVKKIVLKFRKEDEAESAPANSGAGGGVDRITLEEVEKVSVRLDKKSAEGEGAEAEEVRKEKRDKENAAPAAGKVIAQQEPYGRDSEAIDQHGCPHILLRSIRSHSHGVGMHHITVKSDNHFTGYIFVLIPADSTITAIDRSCTQGV